MRILVILFCCFGWFLLGSITPLKDQNSNVENRNQARLIAIKDFSKTKLFKIDPMFHVSVHDTLHQMVLKKIDDGHSEWIVGKPYPDILVIDILGDTDKFFFDTTKNISDQVGIPSRYFAQNGKIFTWWDKHHQLTDSIIKIFDMHHLIGRGGNNDGGKFIGGTNDAKKGVTYYFCRNNLSVYKKIITNSPSGYYAPPKLNCKQ